MSHPLLAWTLDLAEQDGVVCTGRLSLSSHPWLAEHRVAGNVVVPGTALLEIAVRAGDEVGGASAVEEMIVESPLRLSEHAGDVPRRFGSAQPSPNGIRRPACIPARTARHHRAMAAPCGRQVRREAGLPAYELASWPPAGATPVDVGGFYERKAAEGYGYGPVFQGLRSVWRLEDEIYAEITLPESEQAAAGSYGLHPALLDAALHAGDFGALPQLTEGHVALPSPGTGSAFTPPARRRFGWGFARRRRRDRADSG